MMTNNYALSLIMSLLPLFTSAQDCAYFPCTGGGAGEVSFTNTGGIFDSYGCEEIDPTFWLNYDGTDMLITFSSPQDLPAIRVWGMNTDDSAEVEVNGAAYAMDLGSAYYREKVVCGLSPGPDGVVFANGLIVGANTPGEGNYSYSDVVLYATGVTTIRVIYRDGAGYGLGGVLIDCATDVVEHATEDLTPYPNPTQGNITLPFATGIITNRLLDATGAVVMELGGQERTMDLSALAPGCYTVLRVGREGSRAYRVILQ